MWTSHCTNNLLLASCSLFLVHRHAYRKRAISCPSIASMNWIGWTDRQSSTAAHLGSTRIGYPIASYLLCCQLQAAGGSGQIRNRYSSNEQLREQMRWGMSLGWQGGNNAPVCPPLWVLVQLVTMDSSRSAFKIQSSLNFRLFPHIPGLILQVEGTSERMAKLLKNSRKIVYLFDSWSSAEVLFLWPLPGDREEASLGAREF